MRWTVVDGKTFDVIVRGFARRRNRRSMLAALAVVAPFVRRASTGYAQASHNLGAPCVSSSECVRNHICLGFGDVVCADNGYDDDGPLNCCGGAGTLCDAHTHCCGGLMCLGANSSPECGTGTCQDPGSVGAVGIGGSCSASHQCD
jgi:hypothetical protein